MKTIIAALLAFSLIGCVSMPSPLQLAQAGKWQELGFQDGLYGDSERSKVELSELGNMADSALALYQTGYAEGISEFCTPDAAFFSGFSGRTYMNQCINRPDAEEIAQSWEDGLNEYYLQDQYMSDDDSDDEDYYM